MWNDVKSRYRQIEEGRRIWLLKTIKNTNVELSKGTFGKIVHAQNQVESEVWFKDDLHKISRILGFETGFLAKNSFNGLVLNVNATDFAIVYVPKKDSDILIYEDKLCTIPFLTLENIKCTVGNRYKENKRLFQYRVEDLIEKIESEFSQWVSELDTIENNDDGSNSLYVFTASAAEQFNNKQLEIIEKFAIATGIYYEFKGGTIEY